MENKLFTKDFTLVVIGQIISLFGNAVIRFALPLYLLNQTGSSALFGAVLACANVPMMLLSPVGGLAADRVNKRNVMVIFYLTITVCCFVIMLIATVFNVQIISFVQAQTPQNLIGKVICGHSVVCHRTENKKGVSCIIILWYNFRKSNENHRFFEVGTRNCINDEMTSDAEYNIL